MKQLLITGLVSVILAGCSTANQGAGEAHSAHQHEMGDVQADEKGRKLYGTSHEMTPEMLAELRTIKVFAGRSDEEIAHLMGLMGSNYSWGVSTPDVRGDHGVLVLAHGFGDHGDQVLREQLQGLAKNYPVSLALGMSMMTSDHIQLSIDDLQRAGAESIRVIPVVSTRYNSLMRQWEYIFSEKGDAEYASVPRVSSRAELDMVEPIEDHSLVGGILLDYANEISTNPASEEVIIVGHGPVDPDDNRRQLALMENLARTLRGAGGYAAVHPVSLQDDAPREVRMERIQELRTLVESARAEGRDTLIVTNLLGTRVVQSGLRRNLRGLDYRFNSKGLIQHPNFIEWIYISADPFNE